MITREQGNAIIVHDETTIGAVEEGRPVLASNLQVWAFRRLDEYPEMLKALKKIRDARDFNAEHGRYPDEVGGRCFDDWAADVADAALVRAEGRAS